MAAKKGKTRKSPASSQSDITETLGAYAETLGSAMGHLRNHIDSWNGQREHLTRQLSSLVSDAQTLLADLGHSATEKVGRIRRGRKPKKIAQPNPAGVLKAKKPRAASAKKRVTAATAQKTPRARVRRTQNKG